MATSTEILRVDPDLARGLPPRLLESARGGCVAGVTGVPRGEWDPVAAGPDPGGFGLLVVAGHLVRRVGLGGRFGAELLGPGDLLRPWQTLGPGASLAFEPHWRAITAVELAVLDADFAARAAPFPAVAVQLVDRAMLRSRHLAVAMAIVHQPRVEDRLHRLLWQYADRWGRVGPGGTTLEVPLTHGLLAELCAARRPTVSTALGQLAAAGRVERAGEGWILHGDPPLSDS
jgi:CRP/FNR family cyclic AMP-dependent transcriptional regulator